MKKRVMKKFIPRDTNCCFGCKNFKSTGKFKMESFPWDKSGIKNVKNIYSTVDIPELIVR